jgi:hypothetical protein
MEDKDEIKNHTEGQGRQNDCNCEGNCCPPKKKTIFPKIIFSIVVFAALGIILMKLFFHLSPAPAANQKLFRDPNSPVWCDSSGTKACDTAKGSSCCPK